MAELVRVEVLGRFVHESINWLDCAEREEREGLISDDRFAKGVQNVCFLSFLSFCYFLLLIDDVCVLVMQVLQLVDEAIDR